VAAAAAAGARLLQEAETRGDLALRHRFLYAAAGDLRVVRGCDLLPRPLPLHPTTFDPPLSVLGWPKRRVPAQFNPLSNLNRPISTRSRAACGGTAQADVELLLSEYKELVLMYEGLRLGVESALDARGPDAAACTSAPVASSRAASSDKYPRVPSMLGVSSSTPSADLPADYYVCSTPLSATATTTGAFPG
jgi:hypothetical protein